jgi:FKBP-type peptidyl-prolyl cis-trans isomerase FkpA/FKBP-type peptidyl-prolyl cis-trans isomerase FklB
MEFLMVEFIYLEVREGAGSDDIAKSSGLKTEKEQASYMVGMSVGKSLQPIKDDVDIDTVVKAMKTVMSGGKVLLTDEQAQQVAQAFDQRLQAKKVAEAEAAAKKNASEGEAFLAANAKKPGVKTTASGLQYQVLTEGKGARPAADAMVKVHYKGELLDGTEFDNSHDRGEPAVFSLQQVAPGWAEGVQLMPVGSKYKLWIPSKLGYGEQGTPGGPIPPNATLVFEVELLDIVKPDATPDAKN